MGKQREVQGEEKENELRGKGRFKLEVEMTR